MCGRLPCLCVRGAATPVVVTADGQVTLGATMMKHSAKKIRRLYNEKILAGFAGVDWRTLSGLFTGSEAKLEQYGGNLGRSAVELAKDWRTDKLLRQLQALLIVADTKQMFLLSGDGDVIEPDAVADGAIATIGSGGSYALGGGDGVDGEYGVWRGRLWSGLMSAPLKWMCAIASCRS